MLYQFLDWRFGGMRHTHCGDAAEAVLRVRAASDGVLPPSLDTYAQHVAFAGPFQIPIHEMEAVARAQIRNEYGPSLAWVDEQYRKMLAHVGQHQPTLLLDPEPPVVPPPVVPPVVPPEGDKTCSELSPATSPTSSTSTASPNSSATTEKTPSPPSVPSTASPAPKTSSGPPRTK